MSNKTAINKLARLNLIGIFLIFFMPVFVAMLLYFNPDAARLISPQNTNRGALTSPVQTLGPLEGYDVNNQPLDTDLLKGKWTMLYWGDKECDIYCEAGLFKLRQVRLALGREMSRVQVMYMTLHTPADSYLQKLKHRNQKLHIARINADSLLAKQMQTFALGRVYLIDTLGSLILEYDDSTTAKGIFKDLKSLLRASKIG